MNANELAKCLDLPHGRIYDIIREKRAITASTALRLGKFFGTGPEIWMNLQKEYDLEVTEKKEAKKLKSIKEGDSNMLDNSMVLLGSGLSDGNRHSHHDLPIVIGGKGGGSLKSGRHIRYPRETPLCNLYVSMLDRMGAFVEKFGDSKARLPQLS